uniref:Uncharacterized protein n=1 Tax=Meloidogyne hapla TaxID=6305 RepID=A0A1I8BAS8_MELHA
QKMMEKQDQIYECKMNQIGLLKENLLKVHKELKKENLSVENVDSTIEKILNVKTAAMQLFQKIHKELENAKQEIGNNLTVFDNILNKLKRNDDEKTLIKAISMWNSFSAVNKIPSPNECKYIHKKCKIVLKKKSYK